MKHLILKSLGATFLGLLLTVSAFAQEEGDYRSAADGDWSAAATWEVYESGSWAAAGDAPTGNETVTITDTVTVDVAVSISGLVAVSDTGVLSDGDGTLEIADGGVYEHARNEGSIPTASWNAGSTIRITGVTDDAPDNSNQSYHHVVFNTPDLISNEHMSLDEVTIGGDVRVEDTGVARWYLTSASAEDTSTVTIMGDVFVEAGQFAVQGTSSALSVFEVHHYGDIVVTGGNLAASRGSQGNGSGSTTWYLYEGNLSLSDAEMQNSNPEPGQAAFVFAAGGTQQLTVQNVDYAGGDIHFEVADTTTLEITEDFEANGQIVNHGEVSALGSLTFVDGGIYVHARDGGTVPTATWEEGSEAVFTGTIGDAPGDRGQDYYNLTLNAPDMNSNNDLSLDGNTISGDLTVLSSGSARWRLVGGSSGEITIMGDVVVRDASLETQGTGSATDVVIHHYGNVDVEGGNFSVSRGSQASGTGTSIWYLYEGDFSMSGARTQNSNPTAGNARFVFAAGGMQTLALGEDNTIDNLSIEVADSTTLDLGTSEIGGNGVFWVQEGATLATAHPDGLDGNLQTTGEIDLGPSLSITYSGTEAQGFGEIAPDTLQTLTIANAAGVTLSDTNYVAMLAVADTATFTVDTTGVLTAAAGQVDGTIVNMGVVEAESDLAFGATAVYEHARDEGSVPSGSWAEGSTALFTGIETSAPDNRGQDYHHLTLNTPNMLSNLDLSLGGNTIGGDLTVLSSGSARWRLVGGSDAEITIMGDVIVEDASFETQGTGSPTEVVVHHYGNVQVENGNFSVSRGSQGSGTGTSLWYLYEGDFSMTNAESQNSNPTSGNARFIFASGNTQTLTILDGEEISDLSIEVSDSTTLALGTSEILGSGIFWVQDGATLQIAHSDGVAGAIQTSGDVSLGDGINFTFNGTEAQVTSALMPNTVNSLTIDNEAGVTLSQMTTITGTLLLAAGEFDNTIPFVLGPDAELVIEGGSLSDPVSAEDESEVPMEFALHQNYPNPFNPSTLIRYDIKEQTNVTVTLYDAMGREVRTLVDSRHAPGKYEVQWNATNEASGVYYYQIRAGDWSATKSLLLVK